MEQVAPLPEPDADASWAQFDEGGEEEREEQAAQLPEPNSPEERSWLAEFDDDSPRKVRIGEQSSQRAGAALLAEDELAPAAGGPTVEHNPTTPHPTLELNALRDAIGLIKLAISADTAADYGLATVHYRAGLASFAEAYLHETAPLAKSSIRLKMAEYEGRLEAIAPSAASQHQQQKQEILTKRSPPDHPIADSHTAAALMMGVAHEAPGSTKLLTALQNSAHIEQHLRRCLALHRGSCLSAHLCTHERRLCLQGASPPLARLQPEPRDQCVGPGLVELAAEDVARYKHSFATLASSATSLDGTAVAVVAPAQAAALFESSGLAHQALERIWDLAAWQRTVVGALTEAEFLTALSLLSLASRNGVQALPTRTPLGLIASCMEASER